MSCSVEFLPAARREFLALPPQVRALLAERINALGENPRPAGAESLHGSLRGFLRPREGDWRVVYRVDARARVVTVWEIGDRRKVYADVARRRP